VDAGGAARLSGLLLLADAVAQGGVEGVQGAVVPPLVEVTPDGAPGREVLGEGTPLATGPQGVEAGVHAVAHPRPPRRAAGGHRDQGLRERPLLVGEVAGVSRRSHTPFYAFGPPLSDRH